MTREEIKHVLHSYRAVFGSDMGKTVLDDLAKHCNVNRPSVGADPYQTYFNEGKRSVFLRIKSILEIPDLETYLKRYDEEQPEEEDN